MAVTTPPGKTVDGVIYKATGGDLRHAGDFRQLKQGRETHVGFGIGQYLQAPPFFFTRDGHGVPLVDMYRGSSAFLIASGPSFLKLNRSLLHQPGILTMGLNNSPKTFRPRLWTCVDDPTHFIKSIWVDPTIAKFVPFDHAEKFIIDSTIDPPKVLDTRVGDCPNVWYYRRNEYFVAERFLFEDTLNWGNHSDIGGARSVMLPALRILFLLGIRKIFLCGVDFKMDDQHKYHFEQDRTRGSINGNNSSYAKLAERFLQLKPIFERHGLFVYNCNAESTLKAFDYMPFEEAVKIAVQGVPDTAKEPTIGLYERDVKPKAKDIKEQVTIANVANQDVKPEVLPPLEDVIRELNKARSALHEAKAIRAELLNCPATDPRRSNPDYQEQLTAMEQDENSKRKVYRLWLGRRDKLQGAK